MPEKIQTTIKERYNHLNKEFWRSPNRLIAMRATISMGILSIPFIVLGKPYFGVTLALGALAGALSETDDHPKGRIKALTITVLSFFISSFSVGLLNDMPWLLGTGFILSTILFILIGGLGERYRAITFGSILVGIYAMLSVTKSPTWYWHAILLPLGALFHGLLSLVLLFRRPWRLLDEQMAKGFNALSKYLEKKALLFPSSKEDQAAISKDLAMLNTEVVSSLEKIKEVLNNYSKEVKDQELMRPYLQRFMLLQSLHERAASSHERYDKLSNEPQQYEIIEAFGEMLHQLADATKNLSESLLTGIPYRHPLTLQLISDAIEAKLQYMDLNLVHPLILLHHNLHRSHVSLKYLDNIEKGTSIPRLRKDERTLLERIKSLLSFSHPRMRYAIRLSFSFLIGFILVQTFELKNGAWIMLTSLFVSQITYSDTRRRLFQRLLGTSTGVVLGILLIQIFTTTASQVILMLTSALAFFFWLRSNYSVAVIFITIFVLSAFSLMSHAEGTNILVPRLIDTLLGAFLSFIVIRFLWPGWQYKRMPDLISKAMHKNVAYFKAVVEEFSETSEDDYEYRIARREAHLADNELAQAWNSMRLEPKNKRKLMQNAFTLTYLNHALLSYISALGAQRETNTFSIKNINQLTNQIAETITNAGNYSLNKHQYPARANLTPLLFDLQQQISSTKTIVKKQQLRLLYNITSTTARIVEELERTRSITKTN